MLAINIEAEVIGIEGEESPINRRSWLWEAYKIILPAVINRRALNNAWVRRWNRVRAGTPKARLIIINPNWLNVERAITFFMSISFMADRPAISMVREAIIIKNKLKRWSWFRNGKNRIRRKIPPVTRVEECTKADTGVGASIAAGSQLENGIWALFVIPAIVKDIMIKEDISFVQILIIIQFPLCSNQAILIKINTSPIRFVRAVNIPAARDLGFW